MPGGVFLIGPHFNRSLFKVGFTEGKAPRRVIVVIQCQSVLLYLAFVNEFKNTY